MAIDDDRFDDDAFISYKRRSSDANIAELVYAALTKARLDIWKDNHDIGLGTQWFPEIVLGLEKSRCVVAIISRESLESRWCIGEIFMGLAQDAIIPVLVDISYGELPFSLGSRQAVEYRDERFIDRIIQAVDKLRTTRPTRMGMFGRPLPTRGGSTAALLFEVKEWPPKGLNVIIAAAALRSAENALRENPMLRTALAEFNSPSRIHAGLSRAFLALDRTEASPRAWRALATLAQPFNLPIMAAALERAKVSEAEFEDWAGHLAEQLKETPEDASQAKAYVQRYSRLLERIEPLDKPDDKMRRSSWFNISLRAASVALLVLGASYFVYSNVLMFSSHPAPGPTILPPSSPPPLVPKPPQPDPEPNTSGPSIPPVHMSAPELEPQEPPPSPAPNESNPVALSYCNANLECAFPSGGYSYWRVAIECYSDPYMWRKIWKLNAANSRSGDPDLVDKGEKFVLPAPCAKKP